MTKATPLNNKHKDVIMAVKDMPVSSRSFSKKCPFCSTILRLDATECHDCGKKVGAIDTHGMAKVTGKWKAYVGLLFALGLLLGWLYIAKTYL